MDSAAILGRFHESEARNEALVDATKALREDRDALGRRAVELEAVNARLVDMLWGRRSERRRESPGQRQLEFPEGPAEPTGKQEENLLSAETFVNEAADRQRLSRLEARRLARRKQRSTGREEFPSSFERRERVAEAKKAGKYRGRKAGTTRGKPDRAKELRAQGLKIAEIASAMGVSEATVHRYLGQ